MARTSQVTDIEFGTSDGADATLFKQLEEAIEAEPLCDPNFWRGNALDQCDNLAISTQTTCTQKNTNDVKTAQGFAKRKSDPDSSKHLAPPPEFPLKMLGSNSGPNGYHQQGNASSASEGPRDGDSESDNERQTAASNQQRPSKRAKRKTSDCYIVDNMPQPFARV